MCRKHTLVCRFADETFIAIDGNPWITMIYHEIKTQHFRWTTLSINLKEVAIYFCIENSDSNPDPKNIRYDRRQYMRNPGASVLSRDSPFWMGTWRFGWVWVGRAAFKRPSAKVKNANRLDWYIFTWKL